MKFATACIFLVHLYACGIQQRLDPKSDLSAYLIRQRDIRLMEIDPLGYVLIGDGQNRVTKYDTAGGLIFQVVHKNLGDLHSLDVGNPFKILLFYRDQQTIVVVDNTLSEIQRIVLLSWGFQDVTAVALSADNAIWIFDGKTRVLTKTSATGQMILQSDPFDIILPPSRRPDRIVDTGHEVIIKENGQNAALFNDFAGYLGPLDFRIGDPISQSNRMVVSGVDQSILLFDLQRKAEQKVIPVNRKMTGVNIHLSGNHFFLADEKGVYKLPYVNH